MNNPDSSSATVVLLTRDEQRVLNNFARAERTLEPVAFTKRVMDRLIELGLMEPNGINLKITARGLARADAQ